MTVDDDETREGLRALNEMADHVIAGIDGMGDTGAALWRTAHDQMDDDDDRDERLGELLTYVRQRLGVSLELADLVVSQLRNKLIFAREVLDDIDRL